MRIIDPFRFYRGPLDVYSSNIWGAFSVARRLRAAYPGPALRIRETSGSTETDIGFDENGLLDTSAISAHCGANAGKVVTVYDQSGNGNDVTQATASLQMEIYNGSATHTNSDGKIAMYNEGSGNRKHLKLQDLTITQPVTHFLAGEDISQTNGDCRFDGAPAAGFGTLAQQPPPTGSPKQYGRLYAGSHLLGTTDELVASDPFITLCLFDNTNSRGKVDGNADFTGTAGTNNCHGLTWGGFSGGPGNSAADCYHSELLLYNEAVGSSDRDAIRANMNAFYGTH